MHQKMKELIKTQGEQSHKKAIANRKAMQEKWNQEQVQSSMRMQQFFSEQNGTGYMTKNVTTVATTTGIGTYENVMDMIGTTAI